ncbi:MAG: hypothetical protein J5656_04690 [Clostridia bacterium]|nr:hypothetical protein [Clostridia bacterium]
MADEERDVTQNEAVESQETSNPAEQNEEVAQSNNAENAEKEEKKGKKDKKSAKENAKAERESLSAKEKAQKEWEDSIIANKRVKRELTRKKVTRVLALILVLSLLLTSVVYVMLLFIEENSIRITATSKDERTISLSSDGDIWAPKLNVDGPDNMWNISYNPEYEKNELSEQTVPNYEELVAMISSTSQDESVNGMLSTKDDLYIAFSFMLKNTSSIMTENIDFNIRMKVEASGQTRNYGIVDAVRVMWIEEFGNIADHIEDTKHSGVYATATSNEAVIDMQYQLFNMTDEDGNKPTSVPEKWAYPNKMVDDANKKFDLDYEWNEFDVMNGFKDTIPFASEDTVFEYQSYLVPEEVVRFIVVVWIEGSDFDCNDDALDSYVSLGIDFQVL